MHTRQIPLATDVNLKALRRPRRRHRRDLANLANEAALRAARRNDTLDYQLISPTLGAIQLGVARSVLIPEDEKAPHRNPRVVTRCSACCRRAPTRCARCRSSRAAGTRCHLVDTRYRPLRYDELYLLGRIVGALGGMAAEAASMAWSPPAPSRICAQPPRSPARWSASGASVQGRPHDRAVRRLNPRVLGISDETLSVVDAEVRSIITSAMPKAVELLNENRTSLMPSPTSCSQGDVGRARGLQDRRNRASSARRLSFRVGRHQRRLTGALIAWMIIVWDSCLPGIPRWFLFSRTKPPAGRPRPRRPGWAPGSRCHHRPARRPSIRPPRQAPERVEVTAHGTTQIIDHRPAGVPAGAGRRRPRRRPAAAPTRCRWGTIPNRCGSDGRAVPAG